MSIRIRQIDGMAVALCAAKTEPEFGDLYLDDGAHHALASKFAVDFQEEGFLSVDLADDRLRTLMKAVEEDQ